MKVLVTGGSGFLGHNLIPRLLLSGHEARVLDVRRAPFIDEAGVEFVAGDVTDGAALAAAVDGVDSIVHLACNVIPKTSNADPCLDVETNVCGSVRLLEAAVRAGVGRFVFVSSGGTVYGPPETLPIPETHPTNPDCSYGIAKLAVEKYVGMYRRERGLSSCTLRLANPYGEHQRVDAAQGAVAVFCHKALLGRPIEIWGDGTAVRDFVYVGDAVKAIGLALGRSDVHGEINIGSGEGLSINGLLDKIDEITGRKTERRYMPRRVFDVSANVLDIARARETIGWRPETSLGLGIERTLSWIRETAM